MYLMYSNRNFLFIHNVRFHFFCIISTTLVFFFKIDCTGHLKKMLSWKRRNKQDTKINLSDFHGKGTNLDIHFEIYIIKAGVCVFVCGHSNVQMLTSPPILKLWGTQGYQWLFYNLTKVIKLN